MSPKIKFEQLFKMRAGQSVKFNAISIENITLSCF